jgi:uncharacterized cupin superfamily protein
MKTLTRIALLPTLMTVLACAAAGEVVHPVPMPKDQIAGAIFTERKPVVLKHQGKIGEYSTEDVEVFRNEDGKFDAGMYRSGPVRMTISEPYGVNEFMYFLEGGVTLTSADGHVLKVNAGDAVVIPRNWTGIWDTAGYTKIYVIYSPDKPIE